MQVKIRMRLQLIVLQFAKINPSTWINSDPPFNKTFGEKSEKAEQSAK